MTAPRDPMLPELARVIDVHKEAHDTFTLTLTRDAPLPFSAGQFNMLYAFGVGEAPISMSGPVSAPSVLAHTIREVGPVTRALCRVERGGAVGLRGPFGAPWPMRAAAGGDLVIIAGGLGLAPVRPAVYDALEHRADYRRVFVLAGARSPGDLLFRAELGRWQQERNVTVLTTVDHATPDWTGRAGVVPALLAELELDPARSTVLMCGPEVMMRFTVRELGRRGVPDASIYLSMERNMKCAIGLCGHCQLGPSFVCKDGPVLRYDRIRRIFAIKEA